MGRVKTKIIRSNIYHGDTWEAESSWCEYILVLVAETRLSAQTLCYVCRRALVGEIERLSHAVIFILHRSK